MQAKELVECAIHGLDQFDLRTKCTEQGGVKAIDGGDGEPSKLNTKIDIKW